MLASSWASLAHLEAMLGDVGAKMADKIGKMMIKSAKMSQDKRQEEPRYEKSTAKLGGRRQRRRL